MPRGKRSVTPFFYMILGAALADFRYEPLIAVELTAYHPLY